MSDSEFQQKSGVWQVLAQREWRSRQRREEVLVLTSQKSGETTSFTASHWVHLQDWAECDHGSSHQQVCGATLLLRGKTGAADLKQTDLFALYAAFNKLSTQTAVSGLSAAASLCFHLKGGVAVWCSDGKFSSFLFFGSELLLFCSLGLEFKLADMKAVLINTFSLFIRSPLMASFYVFVLFQK